MRTEESPSTPEEARRLLAESRFRALASQRDRNVSAIATGVFGLACGLLAASRNLVSPGPDFLVMLAFVGVCLGVGAWSERRARTIPRRAKLWSRLGLGTSFALALFLVIPWLNLQEQDGPNTWPMVLGGAVVVALPSFAAAGAIARARR